MINRKKSIENYQKVLKDAQLLYNDVEVNKIISDIGKAITNELKMYNEKLVKKKKILVFTKCDIYDENKIKEIKKMLKVNKISDGIFISSVTGQNILKLSRNINNIINKKVSKIDNKKINIEEWKP